MITAKVLISFLKFRDRQNEGGTALGVVSS